MTATWRCAHQPLVLGCEVAARPVPVVPAPACRRARGVRVCERRGVDVLPLLLLVLAAFIVVRLVQMAFDPSARQNAAPARSAAAAPRRSTGR